MGRVFRVANPYYSSGPSAPIPSTVKWTKKLYDGLGRVASVTLPDNNVIETLYEGDTVTVTNQADKQRRQITDALGRVIRLDEPDATGNLGTKTAPTQKTEYLYNALDNLTRVTQGAQVRSFKYDSLGRLTHEKQVEAKATLNDLGQDVTTGSWTGVHKYDTQGLLRDSYDARGVHTHYDYDGLNRLASIEYDGETDPTPDVFYSYDEAVGSFFNKGRLTEVQTKVGSTIRTSQKYNYNRMGQIAQHSQTVNGTSYTTKYLYNLAGQLTKETYPSLRAINYNYDDSGRLASVADATRTFVSDITYAPHGGLLSETWGQNTTGPIMHSMSYNTRLQVQQIKLTVGGVERKRFDYSYGVVNADTGTVDATKNTGQIARVEGFADGTKQWQQRYSYDSIGRLTLASQYQPNNSVTDWRADYDYDIYGNRLQAANQSSGMPYIPVALNDIQATTNRFVSGVTYDDAGNVLVDNKFSSKQYKYDANGRQWWMANIDGTDAATATYDGAGQRVETTANGVTRRMVYDVFGQLIAVYKQIGSVTTLERESIYRGGEEVATLSGSDTQYLMRDHQGSVRLTLDENGTIIAGNDFLPFGGQVSQVADSATQTQQRYAGMYRDEASGLDHTGWRKYDSSSGRWTSPDPYKGSMNVVDPQSFNRYSYVQNDPVNLIDPTGLHCVLYEIHMVQYDTFTLQVLSDTVVGSVALCGIPDPQGRRVRLNEKEQEEFDRQQYLLRGAITEQCAKYLREHDIDPNQVAQSIQSQQPFSGPRSDISQAEAGTIDYEDPTWKELEASDPQRAAKLKLVPVNSLFKKATGAPKAVTGLTPNGRLGATIADRSNVFYSGAGLNMGTIFHESLHIVTGLGDARLAEKLGVTVTSSEPAARTIDRALAAHGCPSFAGK